MSINKISEEFKNSFNKLSSSFQAGLNKLADYGWYTSDFIPIRIGLNPDDLSRYEIEVMMIKLYSENLDNLIQRICIKQKERKVVINEAYTAHKNKMYFSSTSLFLSQADGIMNGKLFKSNRTYIEKYLESKYREDYIPKILQILLEEQPIFESGSPEELKEVDNLNRHAVLHGFDTEYGTELNSYKALSLLAFVVTLVHRK